MKSFRARRIQLSKKIGSSTLIIAFIFNLITPPQILAEVSQTTDPTTQQQVSVITFNSTQPIPVLEPNPASGATQSTGPFSPLAPSDLQDATAESAVAPPNPLEPTFIQGTSSGLTSNNFIPGDFNRDNKVDSGDYLIWRKISDDMKRLIAIVDFNHDGNASGADFLILYNNLGKTFPPPVGDYNKDNKVDSADYIVWRKFLGSTGTDLPADGDKDGDVDQNDHDLWEANFGYRLPGDITGDYFVDGADYSIYSTTVSQIAAYNAMADANGDGKVDAADLDVWKSHYGETLTVMAEPELLEMVVHQLMENHGASIPASTDPNSTPYTAVEINPALNMYEVSFEMGDHEHEFIVMLGNLNPNEVRVQAHTHAHANNAQKAGEHSSLFDLVKHEDMTHAVVKSGNWSDASIWVGGQIPQAGAKVWIPEGVQVIYDINDEATVIGRMRISGTLKFNTQMNTAIHIGTMIVDTNGVLTIGEEADRVNENVKAKVLFASFEPTEDDPFQLGGGLVSHGRVEVRGAEKSSFSVPNSNSPLTAGRGALHFTVAPSGWKVGDKLLIAASELGQPDEEFTIREIINGGRTIRLGNKNNSSIGAALQYDHLGPEGVTIPVANLTRNVIFESADKSNIKKQGHVMFMHKGGNVIEYLLTIALGRTSMDPVSDIKLDSNGDVIAGTDSNPRGRYGLHFHRNGFTDANTVLGTVAIGTGREKWGNFVNHDSFVNFVDNVAYKCGGACFATEVGTEIGTFDHNMAIRSTGSGVHVDTASRVTRHDFGHSGDGFWLQGGGVTVTNNFASGHPSSGIFMGTWEMIENGQPALLSFENLKTLSSHLTGIDAWIEQMEADGLTGVHPEAQPHYFSGNTVAASRGGITSWENRRERPVQSIIENSVIFNVSRVGIELPYSQNVIVRNARVIKNLAYFDASLQTYGISVNSSTDGVIIDNVHLNGFHFGIEIPARGKTKIMNSYINSKLALRGTILPFRREVEVINTTIGPNTAKAVSQYIDYSKILEYNSNPYLKLGGGISESWHFENVTTPANWNLNLNGKQFYRADQLPDHIPFTDSSISELNGKTNQQLWDEFGLWIGGIAAPQNIVTSNRIDGFLADPQDFQQHPSIYLGNPERELIFTTNQLDSFTALVYGKDGNLLKTISPVSLEEGWNLITFEINGQKRTLLMYGDRTPPAITEYLNIPTTVYPPHHIGNGPLKMHSHNFYLTVTDTIDGIAHSNKNALMIQITAWPMPDDPSTPVNENLTHGRVEIPIRDAAGNTAIVVRDIPYPQWFINGLANGTYKLPTAEERQNLASIAINNIDSEQTLFRGVPTYIDYTLSNSNNGHAHFCFVSDAELTAIKNNPSVQLDQLRQTLGRVVMDIPPDGKISLTPTNMQASNLVAWPVNSTHQSPNGAFVSVPVNVISQPGSIGAPALIPEAEPLMPTSLLNLAEPGIAASTLSTPSPLDPLLSDNQPIAPTALATAETSTVNFIPGDANKDGLVDTADYVVIRKAMGVYETNLAADFTGDGIVDDADLQIVLANLGGEFKYPLGDLNKDSHVDSADYVVFRKALETGDLTADLNGDGKVNNKDYEILRSNFGTSVVFPGDVNRNGKVDDGDLSLLLSFMGENRQYVVAADFNGDGRIDEADLTIWRSHMGATAPDADVTAPVISNIVTSNLTENGVTINWNTSEASTAQVEYVTMSDYGINLLTVLPFDPSLATNHSVTLANLQSNTSYVVRIRSQDLAGNLVTVQDFTLTTLGPAPVALAQSITIDPRNQIAIFYGFGGSNIPIVYDEGDPNNPQDDITNLMMGWEIQEKGWGPIIDRFENDIAAGIRKFTILSFFGRAEFYSGDFEDLGGQPNPDGLPDIKPGHFDMPLASSWAELNGPYRDWYVGKYGTEPPILETFHLWKEFLERHANDDLEIVIDFGCPHNDYDLMQMAARLTSEGKDPFTDQGYWDFAWSGLKPILESGFRGLVMDNSSGNAQYPATKRMIEAMTDASKRDCAGLDRVLCGTEGAIEPDELIHVIAEAKPQLPTGDYMYQFDYWGDDDLLRAFHHNRHDPNLFGPDDMYTGTAWKFLWWWHQQDLYERTSQIIEEGDIALIEAIVKDGLLGDPSLSFNNLEDFLSRLDVDGIAKKIDLRSGNPNEGNLTYIITDPPRDQNGNIAGTLVQNSLYPYFYTFTSNAGFSGTVSFSYKINDGTRESEEATVTIDVKPISNQAVAGPSSQTVPVNSIALPAEPLMPTSLLSLVEPGIAASTVSTPSPLDPLLSDDQPLVPTALATAETSTVNFIPGDANKDGSVNAVDYIVIRKMMDMYEKSLVADFTGDGIVNIADFSILQINFNRQFEYLVGDLNRDNRVDAADSLIIRKMMGTSDSAADLNKDGTVNDQDFQIWEDNFGTSVIFPGDVDRNGKVDSNDLSLMLNFIEENRQLAAAADFNGDGRIDKADLAIQESNFGATAPSGDVTAPVISNVRTENLTTSGITINWNTNEASTTQAEHVTGTNYGVNILTVLPFNSSAVTTHSVALTNLQPDTVYHFRVKSQDNQGNLTVSQDFEFRTPPEVPPFIAASQVVVIDPRDLISFMHNIGTQDSPKVWDTGDPNNIFDDVNNRRINAAVLRDGWDPVISNFRTNIAQGITDIELDAPFGRHGYYIAADGTEQPTTGAYQLSAWTELNEIYAPWYRETYGKEPPVLATWHKWTALNEENPGAARLHVGSPHNDFYLIKLAENLVQRGVANPYASLEYWDYLWSLMKPYLEVGFRNITFDNSSGNGATHEATKRLLMVSSDPSLRDCGPTGLDRGLCGTNGPLRPEEAIRVGVEAKPRIKNEYQHGFDYWIREDTLQNQQYETVPGSRDCERVSCFGPDEMYIGDVTRFVRFFNDDANELYRQVSEILNDGATALISSKGSQISGFTTVDDFIEHLNLTSIPKNIDLRLGNQNSETAQYVITDLPRDKNGNIAGVLEANPFHNGVFKFIPNAGFTGDVTFRYRIVDGTLTSEEGMITIKVKSNSDPREQSQVNPAPTLPLPLPNGGIDVPAPPAVVAPTNLQIVGLGASLLTEDPLPVSLPAEEATPLMNANNDGALETSEIVKSDRTIQPWTEPTNTAAQQINSTESDNGAWDKFNSAFSDAFKVSRDEKTKSRAFRQKGRNRNLKPSSKEFSDFLAAIEAAIELQTLESVMLYDINGDGIVDQDDLNFFIQAARLAI